VSTFWASWIPMLCLWSTKCTHACSFFIFGLKFRMGNRWQLVWGLPRRFLGLTQQVDHPCVGATTFESYLLFFPLVLYKTKWCITHDVRYTMMILNVICWLMCATIHGAHIRFMHSILSLKWSVTNWYQSCVDCRTQTLVEMVVSRIFVSFIYCFCLSLLF
jgi:hypothetical protein